MEKKSSELVNYHKSLSEKIRSSTKFFMPVLQGGWAIKFSIFNYNNILLTVTSTYTDQTIIRYYTNENDAVDFINRIIAENPEKYLNL